MTIEIPLGVFIVINLVAFAATYISFRDYEVWNIVCSFFAIILYLWMSKVVINGTLVESFGGITSADTIVTGHKVIEIPFLGYLYTAGAVILFVIMIMQIYSEYQDRTEEVLDDY